MIAVRALTYLALAGGCFWAGIAAINVEAIPRYVAGVLLMAALTFAIEVVVTIGEL